MEIKFEVTQEMYLLLGRIEDVTMSLFVLGHFNHDEEINIGAYAEKLLSYIRATNDKEMMLECCKIDADTIRNEIDSINIYPQEVERELLVSFRKCYSCLNKIKDIALHNTQPSNTKALKQQLPDVLNTSEALKYWEKAKELGLIGEDYNFIGTRYQMAYFAELMGAKLNLKHKWKPFTELWGYDKWAQTRRESKERFGKVEDSQKIESVFK